LASPVHNGESGTTLVGVMVAVAILGLTINALLLTVSNSFKAQRVLRESGQLEDLRSVFRGSVVCQTRCTDLMGSFPRSVAGWDVRPVCSGNRRYPKLEVRRDDSVNGEWKPLYKPNQEMLICKQGIVVLPSLVRQSAAQPRRKICPSGQVVDGVDFAAQSVICKDDR
jgi:hypothetical protein